MNEYVGLRLIHSLEGPGELTADGVQGGGCDGNERRPAECHGEDLDGKGQGHAAFSWLTLHVLLE